MRNSRLPPSCLIFHTNADLSGAYCTVPVDAFWLFWSNVCPVCILPHVTYPEFRAIRIIGDRDIDLDVICRTSSLKLRLDFDNVLYSAATMALDSGLDPDERLNWCGEPVGHELKFTIRGYEGDGPIVLET